MKGDPVTISEEMAIMLDNLLCDYSMASHYRDGERIGGVLQGCPRKAPLRRTSLLCACACSVNVICAKFNRRCSHDMQNKLSLLPALCQ